MTISSSGQHASLIAQADQAMGRGDVRQAAVLLERAADSGPDPTILLRLASVRRSLGDLSGAIHAATAGVELSPRDFILCLILGSLREATGALHGAQRAYRAACANAPREAASQPAMQRQLAWAERRVAALEDWRRRVIAWEPGAARPELNADEKARMAGFRSNVLENIDAGPLPPPVFSVPGLDPAGYVNACDFGRVAEVEAATDAIRAEFLALTESKSQMLSSKLGGLHAADADRDRSGEWSMIPLIKNGRVVDEFASGCPRTMEAAGRLELPKLGLISPSLYFSVLEPNSRIVPHTGITNARLIAHLPLIVPEDCGFRVEGETRRWEPGKMMIFDDMSVHEAWNDSDRIRVVLIADVWRPELSAAEQCAVTELMSCADVTEVD